VRAVQCAADGLDGSLGRHTAGLGLGAGAQARAAQLHQGGGTAAVQGLRVGVGDDEVHPLHTLADHVLHGIAAAAAHTDHLDLRALVELFDHLDCHLHSPCLPAVAIQVAIT